MIRCVKMLFFGAFLSLVSGNAMAYNCFSDCGRAAEFRYPCPSLRNPGRKCTSRNPAKFAACETSRIASCTKVRDLSPLEKECIVDAAMEVAGVAACITSISEGGVAIPICAVVGQVIGDSCDKCGVRCL